MKVAIVADWLIDFGGAELVIKVMHELFPDAPIYTSLYNKENMLPIESAKIIPSWLQKIPFATKFHRKLLPFMPGVFASFDLMEYDLIITNSHAFSKNIKKFRKDAKILCYCHTPTRYLWDDTGYVAENASWWMKPLLPLILNYLRKIDLEASKISDIMVANSRESQVRVKKYYKRDVDILYPPVELDQFSLENKKIGDYFLCGGRLVPYKRYDLAILACNELGLKLKIYGDGPDLARLKSIAGSSIEFLGRVSNKDRSKLYSEAIAYINPQLEDFGITPLEAQASGTPVIAYGRGGALDTVIDRVTGVFFQEQTKESLKSILQDFNPNKFDAQKLYNNAKKFSKENFKAHLLRIVEEIMN